MTQSLRRIVADKQAQELPQQAQGAMRCAQISCAPPLQPASFAAALAGAVTRVNATAGSADGLRATELL